ncbi:MAG: class II aldolase/adducin family protein [Acidovorax sp.]|nr:class II aldolase/adducin family protein [Acidovorax sp.]MDZ7864207.1 class II aldolase/adducin family protein [Acidovorax sp.]
MFDERDLAAARPAGMEPEEWRLRVQLAACYRVFHARGWSEEIFNHITVRVPGPAAHFLINPFGLHYGEVTANNLQKIDLQGHPVGARDYPVNRAGFVIHSAIHAARGDAHCILHTHHTAGVAVSCKEEGLKFNNFYSAFLSGNVAYHAFEGITVHPGEQDRLVQSLGASNCLILRNHGLLVTGRSLPEAFYFNYVLQRACEVQVLADSMAGANTPIAPQALAVSARDVGLTDPDNDLHAKLFWAAVRRAGLGLHDLVAPRTGIF